MVSTACHYATPADRNANVNVVMLVHLSPAPISVAASGCTKLHQVSLGCTQLHQVSLGCSRLHQVSLGCTRLHLCLSSSGGASMIDKMDFDIKKTGLKHGYCSCHCCMTGGEKLWLPKL